MWKVINYTSFFMSQSNSPIEIQNLKNCIVLDRNLDQQMRFSFPIVFALSWKSKPTFPKVHNSIKLLFRNVMIAMVRRLINSSAINATNKQRRIVCNLWHSQIEKTVFVLCVNTIYWSSNLESGCFCFYN